MYLIDKQDGRKLSDLIESSKKDRISSICTHLTRFDKGRTLRKVVIEGRMAADKPCPQLQPSLQNVFFGILLGFLLSSEGRQPKI